MTIDHYYIVCPCPLISAATDRLPFMTIEVLLENGKTFHHHDLESVLFVIIWICSRLEGPNIERQDVAHLAIQKWSKELDLRSLGHLKQAHIDDAEQTILIYQSSRRTGRISSLSLCNSSEPSFLYALPKIITSTRTPWWRSLKLQKAH
jgi:hypothetical protein